MAEINDVCKEKFRVGELRMDSHCTKLDWIMKRANHILFALLLAVMAAAASVWVARTPDPAIARIEKIVMDRLNPMPYAGLPNDSTLYGITTDGD